MIDVEAIIDRVGREFAPPTMDREQLAADLEGIRDYDAPILARYKSSAPARAVRDRFRDIEKAARRLHRAIQSLPEDEREDFRLHWPRPTRASPLGLPELFMAIPDLARLAGKAANEVPLDGIIKLDRSLFEELVSGPLAECFQQHFQREPGASLGAGEQPSGPFIRFVQEALEQIGFSNNGQPYTPAAIKSALSNARAGRSRRKT